MPARTILKDRDSKPLIESLKKFEGQDHLSHKSRVELETVRDGDIIFVEGEPVAFQRKGELIPVLINANALAGLPMIVVDMGAVPHVTGGADVMAPGVRAIRGEFSQGQLVVVVDEKHGKHLAIGKSIMGSSALAEVKKGKVVENLHYVGDSIWEVVKEFIHPVNPRS